MRLLGGTIKMLDAETEKANAHNDGMMTLDVILRLVYMVLGILSIHFSPLVRSRAMEVKFSGAHTIFLISFIYSTRPRLGHRHLILFEVKRILIHDTHLWEEGASYFKPPRNTCIPFSSQMTNSSLVASLNDKFDSLYQSETVFKNPLFHDGGKEWSCCKQRSYDFSLFLAIPGKYAGLSVKEQTIPPSSVPMLNKATQKEALPSQNGYILHVDYFLDTTLASCGNEEAGLTGAPESSSATSDFSVQRGGQDGTEIVASTDGAKMEGTTGGVIEALTDVPAKSFVANDQTTRKEKQAIPP
eukprot:Gb_05210 [translate_table: standard]